MISLWQSVSGHYVRILQIELDLPNCLGGSCKRSVGIAQSPG